jgi:hypothetical protein
MLPNPQRRRTQSLLEHGAPFFQGGAVPAAEAHHHPAFDQRRAHALVGGNRHRRLASTLVDEPGEWGLLELAEEFTGASL